MSIWGRLLSGNENDDPTLAALDEAARDRSGAYSASQPLPLPEIQWAQTVDASEVRREEQWPPARFEVRNQRLGLYHDLWRGDISSLVDPALLEDNSVGPQNIFRRIAKFCADLLVREPPTMGDDDGSLADLELLRIGHSLVTNSIRYGAAYLLIGTLAGEPWLRSVDARYVYPQPTLGDWIIAEPRTRGNATTPNLLEFTIIAGGVGSNRIIRGTPTGSNSQVTIGAPVTELVDLGPMRLIPVLALPEQAEGIIGTSWYDDLATTVVQKARRMAANTRVLDDNGDPLLLLRGNLDNYTTLPGVPQSAAVRTNDPNTIKRDAKVARRLRQAGPLIVPTGIDSAEYVTWDGGLTASMAMLEQLDRDFHFMSGIPAALGSDTAVPSGVSLRRMFWQFDAAIAPLYQASFSALDTAARTFGRTLEWENAFEVIEDAPEATAAEDVPDEATARRGESETA